MISCVNSFDFKKAGGCNITDPFGGTGPYHKIGTTYSIGSILFGDVIPYRWNDVGVSLITLFQVLTLSSWETVMLPLQEIFWWAWIYFFSFIIICAITMMNLLIAVIVDVMLNQKKL